MAFARASPFPKERARSGRWSDARKVDWLDPEMKDLNDEADENDNVLAGRSSARRLIRTSH